MGKTKRRAAEAMQRIVEHVSVRVLFILQAPGEVLAEDSGLALSISAKNSSGGIPTADSAASISIRPRSAKLIDSTEFATANAALSAA
jgi:hypothetical protein